MHFVSEHTPRIQIRPHRDIFSQASGEKIGTQGSIHVKLQRGTAPDWAVEAAKKQLVFAMRPTPGSIGGADVPVEQWCAYIDTVEWQARFNHPDEVRELCEAALLNSADVLQIEPPVLRPPWPKYQTLTIAGSRTAEKVAARNLETAAEIGVTVEELISYEEATLQREEVLAFYREALAAEVDPELTAIPVEA